jgi:hypothetical protein
MMPRNVTASALRESVTGNATMNSSIVAAPSKMTTSREVAATSKMTTSSKMTAPSKMTTSSVAAPTPSASE